MLNTLAQAQEYALQKIQEATGETLDPMEKDIVHTTLESDLFDAISEYVSEEELDKAQAQTPEELESFLFYKIPNYITILEEVTTNFLAEYLSE